MRSSDRIAARMNFTIDTRPVITPAIRRGTYAHFGAPSFSTKSHPTASERAICHKRVNMA